MALLSRPPESSFPPPGASVLCARASRVMLSSRMITSRFSSTIRFAFSSTMSATWMCSSLGSSNVLATTSALVPCTSRCISVTCG